MQYDHISFGVMIRTVRGNFSNNKVKVGHVDGVAGFANTCHKI